MVLHLPLLLWLLLVLVSQLSLSHQSDKLQLKMKKFRAILCSVFRDEEGFLSEYVAYYQLHGLDHIRLYDDGSSDNSLAEIYPWIQAEYVSVVSNTTRLLEERLVGSNSGKWQRMLRKTGLRNTIQRVSESDCKLYALQNEYDFYFNLDIDEYMLPYKRGITLLDTISELAVSTHASIYPIKRYNFASTPHLLEPVNLLTIEAYKMRMPHPHKLTYYKSVALKLVLYLNHPNLTKRQRHFLMNCCNFHNCNDVSCRHFRSSETNYLYQGNGNIDVGNETEQLLIFHYSRSLEKFTRKQKTWQKIGSNNFTLTNFLERNIGTTYDDRASSRYGWQVRKRLREVLESRESYTRPGSWYFNQ